MISRNKIRPRVAVILILAVATIFTAVLLTLEWKRRRAEATLREATRGSEYLAIHDALDHLPSAPDAAFKLKDGALPRERLEAIRDTISDYGIIIQKFDDLVANCGESAEFLGDKCDASWMEIRDAAIRTSPFLSPIAVVDIANQFYEHDWQHVTSIYDLTSFLLRDAENAIVVNDTYQACIDLVTVMHLSEALPREPTLFADSMHREIAVTLYEFAREHATKLTTNSESHLLCTLALDHAREETLSEVLLAAGLAIVPLFEKPEYAWEYMTSGANSVASAHQFRKFVFTTPLGRPVRNLDEIFFLTSLKELLKLTSLPYHQSSVAVEHVLEEAAEAPQVYVVSQTALPGLATRVREQAIHQAQMHLLSIGMAIELYRQANKSYPESLRDVEGTILQKAPVDPLTGTAYVYGLDGEDYFLYSSYHTDEKQWLDELTHLDIWWRLGGRLQFLRNPDNASTPAGSMN